MTRRQAILATAAVVGAMTGQTRAQDKQLAFASSILELEPTNLSFDLNAFKSYQFRLGEREVAFTPQELMDALTPCQHEAASWGMFDSLSAFRVGGRRLEVCWKCATWFWSKEER